MDYAQAIILGLIQGVTELFPVSSLGHSVILPQLFGWTSVAAAVGELPGPARFNPMYQEVDTVDVFRAEVGRLVVSTRPDDRERIGRLTYLFGVHGRRIRCSRWFVR